MQANLDQSISDLLLKVQTVFKFLLEEDTLSNLDVMKDTLARIAQVISNCAQFIKNYSETKSFCTLNPFLPSFLDSVLTRFHCRDTTWKEHRVRNAGRCRRLQQGPRCVDATMQFGTRTSMSTASSRTRTWMAWRMQAELDSTRQRNAWMAREEKFYRRLLTGSTTRTPMRRGSSGFTARQGEESPPSPTRLRCGSRTWED